MLNQTIAVNDDISFTLHISIAWQVLGIYSVYIVFCNFSDEISVKQLAPYAES